LLSKSRYLAGLQCPKRLWHETNAREELPPYDAATEAIFEQGHLVGRLARGLYPGGVALDRERLAWPQMVAATREALRQRVPLYEPAFEHRGAGCRVDILVPVEGGRWDLVEVKSTTEVKEHHLDDVAFQTWVLRGARVRVRRSWLAHLNREYVRSGALDLRQLFVLEDLTDEVAPLLRGIPARVEELQRVARRRTSPDVPIGPQCSDPYNCPLIPTCWADVPDESVFTLYRGGAKSWSLFERGILALPEIPDDVELSLVQALQIAAARNRQPRIDAPAIAAFLRGLAYPLHYFDLESVQFAVPPYDGTHPYQQIPFQFSLHVVERPGAAPRATAFLAESLDDPRPGFLAAARRAVGARGSLVAFNANFEIGMLQSLASDGEPARWIAATVVRFVDLLVPFRQFAYYHPDQLGSASLKAVLPVLVGRGYDHLEIQEGRMAAREFLRSLAPGTPADERQRIRKALLDYCGRDTEGMLEIVEALRQLVAKGS
jgi:hypothetical protein